MCASSSSRRCFFLGFFFQISSRNWFRLSFSFFFNRFVSLSLSLSLFLSLSLSLHLPFVRFHFFCCLAIEFARPFSSVLLFVSSADSLMNNQPSTVHFYRVFFLPSFSFGSRWSLFLPPRRFAALFYLNFFFNFDFFFGGHFLGRPIRRAASGRSILLEFVFFYRLFIVLASSLVLFVGVCVLFCCCCCCCFSSFGASVRLRDAAWRRAFSFFLFLLTKKNKPERRKRRRG